MAVIAPEALTATGWIAADESGRYWRHEARYGPFAIFDRFEVDAIENRGGRIAKPHRAPACRCPIPLALNQDESCAKCGRRVRAKVRAGSGTI